MLKQTNGTKFAAQHPQLLNAKSALRPTISKQCFASLTQPAARCRLTANGESETVVDLKPNSVIRSTLDGGLLDTMIQEKSATLPGRQRFR